jgi:hypothetical protein
MCNRRHPAARAFPAQQWHLQQGIRRSQPPWAPAARWKPRAAIIAPSGVSTPTLTTDVILYMSDIVGRPLGRICLRRQQMNSIAHRKATINWHTQSMRNDRQVVCDSPEPITGEAENVVAFRPRRDVGRLGTDQNVTPVTISKPEPEILPPLIPPIRWSKVRRTGPLIAVEPRPTLNPRSSLRDRLRRWLRPLLRQGRIFYTAYSKIYNFAGRGIASEARNFVPPGGPRQSPDDGCGPTHRGGSAAPTPAQ